MDLDFVSVHKHAKKELGQYPAILTSHLVNNPYLTGTLIIKTVLKTSVDICATYMSVSCILTASFGNWDVEWWNIVPPESAGYDDGVCVGEDSDTFLLSGHDTLVGDLIDGADLLQELRTLNNVQKVSAEEAYSKHSDDQLFPNFTTRQLSWKESVILLLGIVTRHQLTGVALEDILSFHRLFCP